MTDQFSAPYDLLVDGKIAEAGNSPVPMDYALDRAQRLANKRGCTVRLSFGGKTYDIEPEAQ